MSLLRPVRTTLTTAVEVGRRRAGRQGVGRLMLAWVLHAIALLAVGLLVPGIEVRDPLAALLGALVIGLLNAIVRPLLVVLTLPLSVATIGLVSLLINAGMLAIAAPLVAGLEVNSLVAAIAAAIVFTAVTTTLTVILASDQDETFYAELARRLRETDLDRETGGAGLLIVQIDGLSAPVLRNAIRVGITPRMASWVRSGRYRVLEWECAVPSQTSASQAGILHGDNAGIPAFRWYEKDRGRLLVSNRPADAEEIEQRISTGRGLLAAGGTSVGNLFSGDAARTLFVMSRIRSRRAADVDAFSLYFLDPGAYIRTAILTLAEAVKEFLEARRQRALAIEPRVHRGATFALLRAVSNVILRDLNVAFVLDAMRRGSPIIYVDFVDYDELAHHAGPERLESLRSLAGVDRVLASLARAATEAPRRYEIVVLSDHGQSQGATFRDRFGATLSDVVRDLLGSDGSTVATTEAGEGWGPVNALLTEVRQRPGLAGRVFSSALESRTVEGAVDLGTGTRESGGQGEGEVVICASGNLANVYFPDIPGRATLEALEDRHPGLVAGLTSHPGIGFLLVRSAELGAMVLSRGGLMHLDDGRVEGSAPLEPFGPRAAEHLRRLDSFPNVGDLVVISMYDTDLEEVAAFEELVGSHGGLGGPQTQPFLMVPAHLPLLPEPLVGSPAVHRQLVAWADRLGVGPTSGATELPRRVDATTGRPRAIGLIAGLHALAAAAWLAIGFLGLVGELVTGTLEPLVPLVLVVGAGLLVTAYGLWRRRRWAWLATIMLQGISVILILLGFAELGLEAFASLGVLPTLLAVLEFYYLTRPHVAAAFGHRRTDRPSPRASAD